MLEMAVWLARTEGDDADSSRLCRRLLRSLEGGWPRIQSMSLGSFYITLSISIRRRDKMCTRQNRLKRALEIASCCALYQSALQASEEIESYFLLNKSFFQAIWKKKYNNCYAYRNKKNTIISLFFLVSKIMLSCRSNMISVTKENKFRKFCRVYTFLSLFQFKNCTDCAGECQ